MSGDANGQRFTETSRAYDPSRSLALSTKCPKGYTEDHTEIEGIAEETKDVHCCERRDRETSRVRDD